MSFEEKKNDSSKILALIKANPLAYQLIHTLGKLRAKPQIGKGRPSG